MDSRINSFENLSYINSGYFDSQLFIAFMPRSWEILVLRLTTTKDTSSVFCDTILRIYFKKSMSSLT